MRLQAAEDSLHQHGVQVSITDVSEKHTNGDRESPSSASDEEKKKKGSENFSDQEAHFSEQQMIDTARGEIVNKPSWKDTFRVMSAPQTLVTGACYFCTFGTELSVNIILGNYYSENFPSLGLTTIGSWAAMFGLMSTSNDG